MFIGEVIGSVVATRKTDSMDGLVLRLVRKITVDAQPSDTYWAVVDVLGASDGELVLVATGSTARQTHLTDGCPCDAVIMAIVDTWQVNQQIKYTKALSSDARSLLESKS